HQREDLGYPGEFEGRVHHPPLALPDLAVRNEDAVSEDLVEDRPHEIALGVTLDIFAENAIDDIRLGEEVEPAADAGEFTHLHGVAALEEHVERRMPPLDDPRER